MFYKKNAKAQSITPVRTYLKLVSGGAAVGLLLTACATWQPIPRAGELAGCWESLDREDGTLYMALGPKNGEEDLYSFAMNSQTRNYGTIIVKLGSRITLLTESDASKPINVEEGDLVVIRGLNKVPMGMKVYRELEGDPATSCLITWVEYRKISENPQDCARLGGMELKGFGN